MASEGKKGKLKREDLAVLASVCAAAVVIVQKFLEDNDLILLPSQSIALEASVRATALALAKLQTMFSVAEVISIAAAMDDENQETNEENQEACWFVRFSSTIEDDSTWRDNFRMSRASFRVLVESLRSELRPNEDISVEARVGAAVFRLAHGATFRDIGKRFGMPTEAACEAFYEICKILEKHLDKRFEYLASPEGLHAITDGFEALNMPNCCGIIGYTRFSIEENPSQPEYKDHNGKWNIIMQALVDSSGRFLDISVGWPGSFSPSNILPGTLLYTYVESTRELFHSHPANLLNNIPMPQYIIGDQSCPLHQWLLTPYYPKQGLGIPGGGLTPTQELFNCAHEFARRAVCGAFGALKAHWRLLGQQHKRDSIDLLPHIVAAACVLNNFLIKNGEPMPVVKESLENEFPVVHEENAVAESIRDALASHISMVAQL